MKNTVAEVVETAKEHYLAGLKETGEKWDFAILKNKTNEYYEYTNYWQDENGNWVVDWIPNLGFCVLVGYVIEGEFTQKGK